MTEDSNANTNTEREDTNTSTVSNTNTSSDDSAVTSAGSLTVSHPEKNKELETPFAVAGTSSAPTVYARVKNASGTTLFTETIGVRNGEFKANLAFEFTHTTTGTVEVFEKNAAGAETNLVSIPVTFKFETASAETATNTTTNSDSAVNTNTPADVTY